MLYFLGPLLGALLWVTIGRRRKHDWAELTGDAVFGAALGALASIVVVLGVWYFSPK